MTKEQRLTELQVEKYRNTLHHKKKEIGSMKAKNSQFTNIQKEFLKVIENCIDSAEKRIEDVRNSAVWDNLVIAFFGETNAGKSTIIETFRILFGEKERQENLYKNPKGSDGLIVGNGASDVTQIYKEYKMTISGVHFTLIDVPGIEGNEALYEDQIKEALNKAHYVFYIQGQNKKPDSGTASKIKRYLREWVKVYSIYNVRSINSKYKDDKQRQTLLTDGEKRIEAQIKETFQEVLGSTYMGNITLQAYLAMCSKAHFASERSDLIRGQNKLLTYFNSSESLFDFSQFLSLVNLVEQKAHNFTEEIVEANKEKHRALLQNMYRKICHKARAQEKRIEELSSSIKDFQRGIQTDFESAKSNITTTASCKYDEIFRLIEKRSMYAIEYDVGDKEKFCKKNVDCITDSISNELQEYITKQFADLRKNIEARKKKLDQDIVSSMPIQNYEKFMMMDNFEVALDKLDFNLGDLVNMLSAGVGGILLFLAVANFWNPLGWGATAIGVAGAAQGVLKEVLIGGRDKKAEAKEEMRKNIKRAKEENRQAFFSQINGIKQNLSPICNKIVRSVATDLQNIENIKHVIKSIEEGIKLDYSQLNIKDYGEI